MLHVPGILIFHERPLCALEDLDQEGGDVWLIAEVGDGGEDGSEVEDDASAQGESSQGLPIDAKVAFLDREVFFLIFSVLLVRVAGGHEEWFPDLESPAASLYGGGGGHLAKVSVHAERHLLLVVWDWLVDFLELHTDLGSHIPAQGTADYAGAKVVLTVGLVSEDNSKIFGDVI